MAITADVKSQLFRQSNSSNGEEKLIRLPAEPYAGSAASRASNSGNSGNVSPTSPYSGAASSNGRAWTPEEHDRFLEGLEMFPSGPWKEIAAHVGTRTTRQTMTHAQKYREKIARRKRGLRAPSASTSHARALRRQQQQQQQQQQRQAANANAMRDVSPRSVEDMNVVVMPSSSASSSPSSASDTSAIEFAALSQIEDPLDFSGCFGSLSTGRVAPYLHSTYAAGSMHMLEFGSFLADVEPLPMSEEEIDQLLDAAAMLPAVHAETAFIV